MKFLKAVAAGFRSTSAVVLAFMIGLAIYCAVRRFLEYTF